MERRVSGSPTGKEQRTDQQNAGVPPTTVVDEVQRSSIEAYSLPVRSMENSFPHVRKESRVVVSVEYKGTLLIQGTNDHSDSNPGQ